jgi:2-methylcitrate dehydratase PrpD
MSGFDLARAGLRGPRQVLEGEFGYFRLIEAAGRPELLADTLGSQWEVERTSVKPFPSGRATHGVLDAVLQLRGEHGFGLRDVDRVEAWVPSMINSLVGRAPTADMTPGAARLCLAYLVAVMLRDGGVSLDSYAPEQLHDPALFEAAQRVSIHVDDNPDPNAFDPQRVQVRLRSGAVHEIMMPFSLGSPERPMSPAQLEAKFRSNLAVAGRDDVADALYAQARGFADLDDVTTILELM